MFRILRPGGLFINLDKYAADDQDEYVRELAEQMIRYDVLQEEGGLALRRLWIQHEVEDQDPKRIMWTREALEALKLIGFGDARLVERAAQYAIMTAYRPR